MLLEHMETGSLTLLEEQVLAAARRVYQQMGPEHRREIYREALCRELELCEFAVQQDIWLPEMLHGSPLNVGQVADILAADTVAIQVEATADISECEEKHLMTLLGRLQRPLGYIVNFGARDFESGVRRMFFERQPADADKGF